LIRHGHYDVPSFFSADGGVYGRYNVAALVCYLLGILVQMPFIASDVYTGPIARAMGGIDFSWIVGLLAVSGAYYFAMRGGSHGRAGRMDEEGARYSGKI
jgi:NCS1 family nucleobase:cation symporter-1